MERNKKYNWIPTKLSEKSFTSFILPHLLKGKGPEKKLSFDSLFLLHYGVVAQRYFGIGSPIFLAFYGIGAQIDILIKIL